MRTAHRLAMASEHITSHMVEVSEFPQLAVKYGVRSVPKTMIGEEHDLIGNHPPADVVEAILQSLTRS